MRGRLGARSHRGPESRINLSIIAGFAAVHTQGSRNRLGR
jgi:hypothetical protein